MMEELKYIGIQSGDQFVLMDGMNLMLVWFADSLTIFLLQYRLKVVEHCGTSNSIAHMMAVLMN